MKKSIIEMQGFIKSSTVTRKQTEYIKIGILLNKMMNYHGLDKNIRCKIIYDQMNFKNHKPINKKMV